MNIQLIIVVCYFALTIFIGVKAMKKTTSADSFHGSQLGLVAIIAASTGEWLGGSSTTGVSEYGFNFGISGWWYTIANGLGVCVLAIFFAKLYRSLDTVTVPGIIEHFIGLDARVVSSVLLTLAVGAVGISQMVAAGTIGVGLLGIPFTVSVLIMGVGFIIYTLAGGMNAVTHTNTMHLIAMYGGVVLAFIVIGPKVGWFGGMAATLPDGYFSPLGMGFPKVSSWIVASILGGCVAQAGIQPILAASDIHTARKAAFITAAVVAPFGFFTVFMGMAAKTLALGGGVDGFGAGTSIIGLEDGKMALPTLLMLVNPLVGGIVISSIFAAILSTVSPIILACGTMITKDLYQRKFHPDAPDAKILRMSRITTGIVGVICTVGAMALYDSSAVLDLVYSAYSLRGAIFVTLLYAIYYKGGKMVSNKAACIAMILTGITSVSWVVVKMTTGQYPISKYFTDTYAGILAAAIFTFIFIMVFPKKKDGEMIK